MIDGTGTGPVPDAVVLIEDGKIPDPGPREQVTIPDGWRIIDVHGGCILPGFIKSHVHNGYDAKNLRAWASSGVKTVRDMDQLSARPSLNELRTQLTKCRNNMAAPEFARLACVGYAITVPNG